MHCTQLRSCHYLETGQLREEAQKRKSRSRIEELRTPKPRTIMSITLPQATLASSITSRLPATSNIQAHQHPNTVPALAEVESQINNLLRKTEGRSPHHHLSMNLLSHQICKALSSQQACIQKKKPATCFTLTLLEHSVVSA